MKDKNTAILWLLALVQFLVVLDSAIVNVALPAIKTGLNFEQSALQWVVTAYVLTFGGFLMLGGRTADLFGRRKVLVIGVTGFTTFSLLLGLTQNDTQFIMLRALQGLAAAFMAPSALSILITTFQQGHERNKALSVWAMVASGGAAAGVFLGGLLTEYLGWRWNFFVNVPIGLFAVWGILTYVPAHIQEAKDRQLDIPGAVLVTGGLMSLVYALAEASRVGWINTATLMPLVLSIILLASFLVNETRTKHPLVPLGIFKIRNVTGGNLIMLPVMAGALGLFFFASLYIQNILHYSPLLAGACFLPIPIVIGIVSRQAPRLITTFGFKRLLVAGTALLALSTFILSLLTIDSSYWLHMLPAFILLGCGAGLSFVAVTVAATTGAPGHQAGLVSGLINTSQQLGAALGVAILAVVANAGIAAGQAAGLTKKAAELQGYQDAFLASSILLVLALVVSLLVIKESKGTKHSS